MKFDVSLELGSWSLELWLPTPIRVIRGYRRAEYGSVRKATEVFGSISFFPAAAKRIKCLRSIRLELAKNVCTLITLARLGRLLSLGEGRGEGHR